MGIIVIVIIIAMVSAGILILIPGSEKWADSFYRLSGGRQKGIESVRETVRKATAEAGRLPAYLRSGRKKEIVHKEIYSALSVLRNHAASECGSVTTDFLLESFSQTDGILKNAYSGSLRLFRTGRRAEAAEYFAAAAEISFARDFILLILDWDAIRQNKQKRAIIAFQNALKEIRTTELTRKNEVMSDFVYMPVVAGVLVIFVNFIYVAYFAEQSALLNDLFY